MAGAGQKRTFQGAFKKRTSQGLKHKPKNKHKRKAWKAYNRQGLT